MTGESHVPDLVSNDIHEAVRSAIQFGCSAAEFKRIAAEHWDAELADKRRRDHEEFSK